MLQFQEQEKMGKDRFHASPVKLTFSVPQILLTLSPGEVKEGSFTIYGTEREQITGFVFSSKLSMKCLTPTFSGSRDEISYRFDARHFSPGDQVEGSFLVLSDHGEYQIPYHVKIMPALIDSSLGPVRNLYHFTNLSKTNWLEAGNAFYNPLFASLFSTLESNEFGFYRGLCAHQGDQQNLEEFLISIGRKKAIEFLPEQNKIQLNIPAPEEAPVKENLTITRNGWGYTCLRVRCVGGFLKTPREILDANDFREGSCSLLYTVDTALLHQGKNFGHLILEAPFAVQDIPVCVTYEALPAAKIYHRRKAEEAVRDMMLLFASFRMKKLEGREFLTKMDALIASLGEHDHLSTYPSLYRIHYLLTAKKAEQARLELQNLNRRLSGEVDTLPPYERDQFDLEDDTEYVYRMYLTMLCAQKEIEENRKRLHPDPVPSDDFFDDDTDSIGKIPEGELAAGAETQSMQVKSFSATSAAELSARITDLQGVVSDCIHLIEYQKRRNPDNFWIAWLYLYATGSFARHRERALEELEHQFEAGSRSPVLYLEAYFLVRNNPAILHGFDDFSLQVLLYAARNGILTDAVMTQVNYLTRRQKSYSAKLALILKKGYELDAPQALKNETLQSICTLLIRGNIYQKDAFSWYQKGVDAGLQITRLFDYYMLSLPDDFTGEIPQMVLLYFAYQSALPEKKNAGLYRYVLEHAAPGSTLYDQYHQQILSFTQNALLARHMSEDLAFLFEWYMKSGAVLPEELLSAALPSAFMCRVETKNEKFQRVVLIYDACRGENYFPLRDGSCYVPIFGEQYHLFLEDGQGHRYAGSADYTITRMMDYKVLSGILSQYETDNVPFDLYLSESQGERPYDAAMAKRVRHLCDAGILLQKPAQDLCLRLLSCYETGDDVRDMDDYLKHISPDSLDSTARGIVMKYLVRRGLTEQALNWLRTCGSYGIEGGVLMRLLSGAIEGGGITAGDTSFAMIAHECFMKGKYDEKLLLYMADNYDGTTKELEELRKACLAFGTDDYALCRRELVQMLYTGETLDTRDEIIEHYKKGGADTNVLTSVLAQSAHYHVVRDDPMGKGQFDLLTKYGRDGVPVVDVCRIAWLKDLSERSGEITDDEQEVAVLFLGDLLGEGIVFPFFRQFLSIYPDLQAYADDTLYEVRVKDYDPMKKIRFHYAMEKDGVRSSYQVKEMKEMYEGIYVTGFLLFFGEQMHYYITDDERDQNVIESGTLGQDARILTDTDDRFGMINRISMLCAIGRDSEAIDRMENYTHRAFLVDRIFEE